MKLPSLVLLAALPLAASAIAQTASPTAPPAEHSSGKIDKACKKQIKDLCGHAHGQEMTDCVKSGLDMNKFDASCTAEIKAHKSKS
jgi:hypothetical protein